MKIRACASGTMRGSPCSTPTFFFSIRKEERVPDTILVTGGCGFIGRHVLEELRNAGHTPLVIDSMVEQVHGAAQAPLDGDVEIVRADLRSREALAPLLARCDGIIHLAAEVGVGQSMYEIERYIGGNDLATAILLELCIEERPQKIVVASSMSVYGEGLYSCASGEMRPQVRRNRKRVGDGRWDPADDDGSPLAPLPTDETKPVDLASIYALTKYAQERQVLIFGEAYGVDAVALRLFNVYGAGQALSNPYTGVLANFASRLANGQSPLLFEDGLQKRDFVHVRDVARAFRLAYESRNVAGQVINIGSGQPYTIVQIAELLAEAMGVPERRPEMLGKARAGDIRHCFADISRAREMLGFEPIHRLEDALPELAAWVRTVTNEDRSLEMRRQLEQRGLVT